MKKTSKYIKEDSYQERDIPKYFYVAFHLSRKQGNSIQQLKNRKLEGVKGISSSGEIIVAWGAHREAILIMPGREFVSKNNVTRILYDNPDYMVSNGAQALARIYNKKNFGHVFQQIISDDGYVRKYLNSIGKTERESPLGIFIKTSDAWKMQDKLNSMSNRVRNIGTFAKALIDSYVPGYYSSQDSIEFVKKNKNEFIEELKGYIVELGKLYEKEQEWNIKGDSLIIPNNSTLSVVLPNSDYKKIFIDYYSGITPQEKWPYKGIPINDRIVNIALAIKESGIDDMYKISFIYENALQKAQVKRMFK